LKTEHRLEALVSRESSFLFNNILFLTACFTILWGTLYPVLSEYFAGYKQTVNAPYYNRVAVPIGMLLLFLTGIGPLLAWRSSSFRGLRKNVILPGAAAVLTAIALMLFRVRPWQDAGSFYSWVCFSLAAFVITGISAEFLRGAAVIERHTGKGIFQSMLLLCRRNTRRYGGYIVHFGIVVMFIGLAGSAFNRSVEKEMSFGQTIEIGPYTLVNQSNTQDSNPNFDTEYSLLDVYRGGVKQFQLSPERRFYQASQTPQTMVANHSTLAWDLYVVYEGKNPDTGLPIIKVFLNPLVMWIWIGVGIIVVGTFVALTPNLSAALVARRVIATPVTIETERETVQVGS
jgi:cytochrome c-type biogenesis protein CcmF